MSGIRKLGEDVEIRKRKSGQTLRLTVILILVYGMINSVTTYIYYCNYNQKIDILAEMAAKSDRNGIDVATGLLKSDQGKAIDEGRQILQSYGYLQEGEDVFYQRFLWEVMITAVSTSGLFLVLFFLLSAWKQSVKREEKDILSKVEDTIEKFRSNDFEGKLEVESLAEQDKIKFQLEALGNYVKLLKEQARLEKEGTKELVSDISHQLKTPVAALDTCFSVLISGNLSEKEQEEFQVRCRNALDGLETLLQSLLEISKLEIGLIHIEKRKLPLMDTIVTAVNRVYPKASEKNIEFNFNYEEGLENYEIEQDKKWLSEAIINVLDNAIKYSEPDSEVSVRVQKRRGFARIEIEDHGIGIPKEEYHKIFQRFFRGSNQKVKEACGSGIGLFLTREIIEKHHGTITVSSNLEGNDSKHGSTFAIQLPVDE